MSDQTNIGKNLKWLYGENLVKEGKPVSAILTIDRVEDGAEFVDGTGRKSVGHAVYFKETTKALGVTGATVTRQLILAMGSQDYSTWAGKKVKLYAVPSKKSVTGWAVRVAGAES